jgi:hypothetical protein
MMYLMPLSICGADNTQITVVNSPVALRRGGALTMPFYVFDDTAHNPIVFKCFLSLGGRYIASIPIGASSFSP